MNKTIIFIFGLLLMFVAMPVFADANSESPEVNRFMEQLQGSLQQGQCFDVSSTPSWVLKQAFENTYNNVKSGNEPFNRGFVETTISNSNGRVSEPVTLLFKQYLSDNSRERIVPAKYVSTTFWVRLYTKTGLLNKVNEVQYRFYEPGSREVFSCKD